MQGEQPYETAALLSMRGVSTVVVNSLAVLADEHCCLLHNLFSVSKSTGAGLYDVYYVRLCPNQTSSHGENSSAVGLFWG